MIPLNSDWCFNIKEHIEYCILQFEALAAFESICVWQYVNYCQSINETGQATAEEYFCWEEQWSIVNSTQLTCIPAFQTKCKLEEAGCDLSVGGGERHPPSGNNTTDFFGKNILEEVLYCCKALWDYINYSSQIRIDIFKSDIPGLTVVKPFACTHENLFYSIFFLILTNQKLSPGCWSSEPNGPVVSLA